MAGNDRSIVADGQSDPELRVLLEALLVWVSDDVEILGEVLPIFLEETPHLLETMKSAVAAHDATAIARTAHNLKGSLANFGRAAKGLRDLAYRFELAGSNRQLEDAAVLYPQMETGLQKLFAQLKTIRAQLNMERAERTPTRAC